MKKKDIPESCRFEGRLQKKRKSDIQLHEKANLGEVGRHASVVPMKGHLSGEYLNKLWCSFGQSKKLK